MYNSQPQVGIRLQGPSENRRKLPQNIVQFVSCHLHNIVLKKDPLPLFVHVTSKKCPYILHMLHKNFACWKQFKFFISSGNLLLRESPFDIVNCLKLFDFTSFFVYTLKVIKGPPSTHIFALFWKTYDLLQSGLSSFKQNNAKTMGESLRKGSRDISEKRGPQDDRFVRLP